MNNLKNFLKRKIRRNTFLWKFLLTIYVFIKKIKEYERMIVYRRFLRGKYGLEIGGPSNFFREILPIYSIIRGLDGCNYGKITIWEGNIKEGQTYEYHPNKKKGYQFICDAVDLKFIPSLSYDFILASHVIEHIANPIKALLEWLRILKENGILLLVVPHRDGTFDHNRPITTLKHLLDDFEKNIKEDDLTHLPEILELHDLTLDPQAGDFDAFKKRSLDNFNNRCLHHHIFDTKLVVEIFDYLGLQVLSVDVVLPYHIIVMGKKVPKGKKIKNGVYLRRASNMSISSKNKIMRAS